MIVKIKKTNSSTIRTFLRNQPDVGVHFNTSGLIRLAEQNESIYYTITTDSRIIAVFSFYKSDQDTAYINFTYVTEKYRGIGLMYVVAALIFGLPFFHYPTIKYVWWNCLTKEYIPMKFYDKLVKDTGDKLTSCLKHKKLYTLTYVLGKDYVYDHKCWNFIKADNDKILKEIISGENKEYDIADLLKQKV